MMKTEIIGFLNEKIARFNECMVPVETSTQWLQSILWKIHDLSFIGRFEENWHGDLKPPVLPKDKKDFDGIDIDFVLNAWDYKIQSCETALNYVIAE